MREVAMKGADEEEGDLRIFRSPEPKICGVPRRVFYFMLCGLLVCAAVGAGIGVALEPSGRALAAKQGDNVGQADPPEIKTYTYLPYDVIVDKLLDLQTRFPHFVEVFTTQERYGLGTRGTCTLQGTNQGCKVYVIRIANKQLLTPSTPEVFFSGTLHGNERIGPTAVTEFATYLLEMYNFDTWAKRLVDTRAITIVPAANAVGYAHNTREEEGIDANRDFAWNQDSGHCFKTIAARSINELWREHLFQLSITFHGGDHMVAYPWGDYLHCNGLRCSEGGWTAPDETGMKDLVDNIRSFVGSYNSGKDGYYKVGALNDVDATEPHTISSGSEILSKLILSDYPNADHLSGPWRHGRLGVWCFLGVWGQRGMRPGRIRREQIRLQQRHSSRHQLAGGDLLRQNPFRG
mmetsp:Transcript_28572/g.44713  ORF Transcript_28572/g.44713 Transcript_28572/m.44713 type:complete len:406 (-) Transcript_28572:966-2183(-)